MEVERGKGNVVKKYFEGANTNGAFLLWKGNHITIVVNKVVNEFSAGQGGYKDTAVKDWVSDNTDYHLYKLPANRQF